MSVKYQILIKFVALTLVLAAACIFVFTSCAATSSLEVLADHFRDSVDPGTRVITEVFSSAPAVTVSSAPAATVSSAAAALS